MDLNKANKYINDLYSKHGVDQDEYIKLTKLREYGHIIDRDVSLMMQVLLSLNNPKLILEIGTSIGYSTVSMAEIIKEYNGKIITIESDKQVAMQAIENFKHMGVADYIEVKIGDAQKILPKMTGEFDVIFQDVGDKTLYSILLNDCIRLLKNNGLLLAEDTLFPIMDRFKHYHESIASIHKFNEMVSSNPDLISTIIPIGDGLTVSIKKNDNLGK